MNNFKSTLTCSYCSKIYKDAIELPCKHILCKEHLTEKDIVKENRIKCGECKQEFQVKNNEFRATEIFKEQLDDFLFLSHREFSLKMKIQYSIQKLFEMYEEFTLNKTTLDLDVSMNISKK
jgi:hypothetical protein